jgi:prepilin-type N-terminal cleavage/methylation domain-containing protein
MSREQRGFSLIETLVGLLILAFVLTTSLTVFGERQRRLRSADELIVVYQALANEAEVSRVIPFPSLSPGTTSFRSDTSILAGLVGVTTSVTVKPWRRGARLVEMTVEWNDGARSETMSIVRADMTPGGSFW